jgi:hypothetical protein
VKFLQSLLFYNSQLPPEFLGIIFISFESFSAIQLFPKARVEFLRTGIAFTFLFYAIYFLAVPGSISDYFLACGLSLTAFLAARPQATTSSSDLN